jgi:hypothetical protein
MLKNHLAMIAIAIVFTLAGCQNSEPVTTIEAEAIATSDQLAIENWGEEISAFREWQLFPGTTELQESQGNPHSEFGSIYANPIAQTSISANAHQMPDGAIVARECFDKDQELIKITTMRKTEGQWFYSVYDTKGNILLTGETESCVECHKDASKDSLFLWEQIPAAETEELDNNN